MTEVSDGSYLAAEGAEAVEEPLEAGPEEDGGAPGAQERLVDVQRHRQPRRGVRWKDGGLDGGAENCLPVRILLGVFGSVCYFVLWSCVCRVHCNFFCFDTFWAVAGPHLMFFTAYSAAEEAGWHRGDEIRYVVREKSRTVHKSDYFLIC